MRTALVLSVLLFLGGMLLYTRGNGFPYDYHPDEPIKVRQLISGQLNFHHPLLLLSTVDAARKTLGQSGDPQRVVEIGRWVSAIFASLGVLAFIWTGYLKGGPWVAAGVAAFLLPHHQVFELAHYLKEDTALFMGTGLTLLALAWAARTGTATACGLLGAAAGIAVSAKYLGATVGLVALGWLLFVHSEKIVRSRKTFIAWFFAGLILVTLLINYRFLLEFHTVQTSFEREMDLAVNGQGGVTRHVPHLQYTGVFLNNTGPVIWLGLLGCLVFAWRTRHERSLDEWLLAAFGLGYVVLLSFSPKCNDRYFLPVTGVIGLGAGFGLRQLFLLARLPSLPASILSVVLALAGSLPGLVRYDRAFQIDDRRDLAGWIRTNLPPGTIIAQEKAVQLPGTDDRKTGTLLPQKFLTVRLAPDLGTLDDLRRQGITDVLVSRNVYGKFYLASLQPNDQGRDLYTARKTFYDDLFQHGRLLWQRPRSTVIYLHPGLELFALDSLNPPGPVK